MALLRSQTEKSVFNTFSSFMSVPHTLEEVVKRLLMNERLKRLLYYTDQNALKLPRLTQQQSFSLLNNQIRLIPKLSVDPDVKPYIIISLDSFIPQKNQTSFRNISLSFDILCAYDHWNLGDYQLRPYSIAGEIDGMINNSFSNGKGIADFTGARQLVLNEHLGGVSLYYNLETFTDDLEKQVSETSNKLL